MDKQAWDLLTEQLNRIESKLDQVNGKVQQHEQFIQFVKKTFYWVAGLVGAVLMTAPRWWDKVKGLF